jgi:ABC-2 type transport system permease protein
MTTFKTLLQREWMQHHRGWLAVMFVPPLLVLAVFLFTGKGHIQPHMPLALMVGTIVATTALVFFVTWIVTFIQASGLARRDHQDRSIEFWLSLPVSHTTSVGATVLMHALLVPLMALGAGYLCSLVVGLLGVTLTSGITGLAGVPWTSTLLGSLATILRVAFGTLLGALWVLPLLLMAMASSAWLKRWGVPVLAATLLAGHVALSQIYGITVIGFTITELFNNAMLSLIHGAPPGFNPKNAEELFINGWPVTPHWLVGDAMASVGELASPLFIFALITSAVCFGLLVLRRSRG